MYTTMKEITSILNSELKKSVQTIETERMIVGYVYFLTEDGRRALVVHDLFVKKRFRNQGLASQFIKESFDLSLFDMRISINIMSDVMYRMITSQYSVRPISKCLDYQIEYPSFVYCKGEIPRDLIN